MSEEDKKAADDLFDWISETLGIDLTKDTFAEDDWTLVVKLHAMIETALNTSLVTHLALPELHKIIGKLETSNPAIGKIAFAKTLKILDKEAALFLQKLSELRNFCVHDIRNFDFDLPKHFSKLDEGEQKA